MHAREALVNSSDVSAEVEAWEEVMSGPLERQVDRWLVGTDSVDMDMVIGIGVDDTDFAHLKKFGD